MELDLGYRRNEINDNEFIHEEFRKYYLEEKVACDIFFEIPRQERSKKEVIFYNENYKRAEYIENLYCLAKLGSHQSQVELLNLLIDSSKGIFYSYKKSLSHRVDLGLNDIKNIIYKTFNHLMELENVFNDCENFFKFMYIRDVNQFLRKKYLQEECKLKSVVQEKLDKDNLSLNDLKYNEFKVEDELVKKMLNDKRSNLNESDKVILELILLSYSITDIAKEINICYSVTFRRVKRVLLKCEIYIKNYLPDIFNRYYKKNKN